MLTTDCELLQFVALTQQEANLESLVWILGPIVVAFFGFLFWFVMGKLGSDQSKGDDEKDEPQSRADHPDE